MDDRELTRALEALGLDRTRWRAVALLPLIEVAWADGRVQRAERELLAEIAVEHGLRPDEVFLERWLARRPPKTTFVAARTLLLRLWTHAGRREAPQPQTLEQLLDLCTEVAEAAGGLLGIAFTVERSERDVIREIASSLSLGPALPEPVRRAWSEETTVAIRPPPKRSGGVHDAPTTKLVVPRLADDTTRIRPRRVSRPALSDEDQEVTRPYLDHVEEAPGLADIDD